MGAFDLTKDDCYWTLGVLTLQNVMRQTDDEPHDEIVRYVAHVMNAMNGLVAAVTAQKQDPKFDRDLAKPLTIDPDPNLATHLTIEPDLDLITLLAIDFAQNCDDIDERTAAYAYARAKEAPIDTIQSLQNRFKRMHRTNFDILSDDYDYFTLGDMMKEKAGSQKQTIADGKLIADLIANKMVTPK